MAILTNEAKQDYIKSPVHCPFCGSTNIESGPIHTGESDAWASVDCLDCKEEWEDIYTLTDINYPVD